MSKISIFEISREYRDILEELEENGGEITESIADRLAINKSDFEEKCESYKVLLEHIESTVKRRDLEIIRLKELNNQNIKFVDSLKYNLEQSIKLYGESKITPTGKTNYTYSFKDKDFKLVAQASESVILNSDFYNPYYMNFKIATSLNKEQIDKLMKVIPTLKVESNPDKTAIKKAMDNGENVEGVSISTKYSTKFK